MWETPEQIYIINEIPYAVLLDGEVGTKHLVNPWAMMAGQGALAACDSRQLTHIDALSREPVPVCEQCVDAAARTKTDA